MIYYIILGVILLIGIVLSLVTKRNYFNKHKYIRVEKYHNDKSISVNYYKRSDFNKDKAMLINPDHIYLFKGYTTVMTTSEVNESINPLDFENKFALQDYKTAIKSKLVKDTFESMKVEKFDKVTMLLLLSGIQLLAIVYLLYSLMGSVN